MLEELLATMNNWFERRIMRGRFVASGSEIGIEIAEGQYFRVVGSTFNDGLHKYPEELASETFDGEVWLLGVPHSVVDLADRIQEWRAAHPEGEFASESFGGYSYSKATDGSGAPLGWRAAFKSELAMWRKI